MPYGRDRTIIIPDLFIVIKLLEYKSKTATDIQFESKLNYAHVHNVKTGMIKHGLVNINKKGRDKFMSITGRGQELLRIVNQYLELFNIKKEDMVSYRKTSEEARKRLQEQEEINKEVKENDDNKNI